MAANHKFEVVEKEVIFTEEGPDSPFKLFDVSGDVLARIVPVIKDGFSTEDAILNVGEQGKSPILLYMDSKYERKKESFRPVSSDLYLTVSVGEGVTITSGTVIYYCIFAKLSSDGNVEEVE